jgi:hypothetical protein
MAEPALHVGRIAEAFDVVKERATKLGLVRPRCRVTDPGEFAFEGGPECVDHRVVVAVASGAEGSVELELSDALGDREGGIGGLVAAVMPTRRSGRPGWRQL